MNTAEKIEVMQAFEDGKSIEFRCKDTNFTWVTASAPSWDWSINHYRIVEPKPETLEDRVKDEYPDYEVVMLEWCDDYLCHPSGMSHITAQSMKGFAGYVYDCPDDPTGSTFTMMFPPVRKNIHPVAILFTKVTK